MGIQYFNRGPASTTQNIRCSSIMTPLKMSETKNLIFYSLCNNTYWLWRWQKTTCSRWVLFAVKMVSWREDMSWEKCLLQWKHTYYLVWRDSLRHYVWLMLNWDTSCCKSWLTRNYEIHAYLKTDFKDASFNFEVSCMRTHDFISVISTHIA